MVSFNSYHIWTCLIFTILQTLLILTMTHDVMFIVLFLAQCFITLMYYSSCIINHKVNCYHSIRTTMAYDVMFINVLFLAQGFI